MYPDEKKIQVFQTVLFALYESYMFTPRIKNIYIILAYISHKDTLQMFKVYC